MKVRTLEKIIVESFCNLSVLPLTELNDEASYSYNNKFELIDDLKKVFNKIKLTGIGSLKVQDSKCKYCYPTGKTYSFHNPDTDEFIIRYVIHQESETSFRVEECRNRVLPNGDNGMPF